MEDQKTRKKFKISKTFLNLELKLNPKQHYHITKQEESLQEKPTIKKVNAKKHSSLAVEQRG